MKRLALVCSIASVALLLSGCLAKKKDAEAIDAAAAVDPTAAAAVDDAAVAAADDAGVAPLAPLASAVVKPVVAVKPKAPVAPAANPDAPNCANARLFCNHPKVATDPKIKAKCASFTTDCLAAGGKV
ncbi:MAG: hypothetical protein ABIP89_04620 [Polyangiaceae bacterium]